MRNVFDKIETKDSGDKFQIFHSNTPSTTGKIGSHLGWNIQEALYSSENRLPFRYQHGLGKCRKLVGPDSRQTGLRKAMAEQGPLRRCFGEGNNRICQKE